MLSFRDIYAGLKSLGVDHSRPVMVHASLSAFGDVRGGVDTLLGGLLGNWDSVLAPTFTYKTMLTPEEGPENNGLTYGSGRDQNQMAEFYTPDKPADRMMGVLAETLRKRPNAMRSNHPILSFAGVNASEILLSQTLDDPLAPIGALVERDGWVLLLGVDHTVNTSIHYAEKLAGRKQFVRWALQTYGVTACPGWPGCSDGFEKAAPLLEDITHSVQLGPARVRALPLQYMMDILVDWIKKDPLALLCTREECERCDAVRAGIALTV